MSQQGLLQASIRAITGSAESYEGDWHRLFDLAGVAAGQFDGRLLRWINLQLGTSYTFLPEAQQAYAAAQGAYNWSSLGSIFTPTALGSLLLGYWDAERTSTLTIDESNRVSSWRDVVAGYDVAQATDANKPTYSATSFNSRPGLTFNGTSQFLGLASVPFPASAQPCEIWALVDQTALVAETSARTVFSYGDAVGTSRQLQRVVSSSANRAAVRTGDGATGQLAINTTVDLSGRHVLRGVVGATTSRCDADGAQGSNTAVVPATATARTRIGANAGAVQGNFFQGVVPLVAITSPLTASQAAQMAGFLDARAG